MLLLRLKKWDFKEVTYGSKLTVQIVTPDGSAPDHHASFVSVRTLDGEMGILPRHAYGLRVLAVDS